MLRPDKICKSHKFRSRTPKQSLRRFNALTFCDGHPSQHQGPRNQQLTKTETEE